jgi:hypothetical protein
LGIFFVLAFEDEVSLGEEAVFGAVQRRAGFAGSGAGTGGSAAVWLGDGFHCHFGSSFRRRVIPIRNSKVAEGFVVSGQAIL